MTLEQYLSNNEIKPSVFAADLGVPPSTITRLLKGERSPRIQLMSMIREKTGGAVTPNDFAPEVAA